SDPAVMMGKPVVVGTRITVELILDKLAAGESIGQILLGHPHLTEEGIHAALAFAAGVLRFETRRGPAADPHPRIIRRSEIGGGEPIIAGTRISVREIVERMREGQSVEEMAANLPPLTPSLVYD